MRSDHLSKHVKTHENKKKSKISDSEETENVMASSPEMHDDSDSDDDCGEIIDVQM